MALYTVLHLFNLPRAGERAYAQWFNGEHRDTLAQLHGCKGIDRFEVSELQIMPDIPQPWHCLTVYDCDFTNPEFELPALGALLSRARAAALIDDSRFTERIYSYVLDRDWVYGPHHQKDQPFSGLFFILANYVAGMEEEYHRWYDQVHIPEVLNVPGHAAMRRGALSRLQIEPIRYCPGNQLVMCAHQTADLRETVAEFSAQARGVSASGIAMAPRSKAASFARTVHYFRKLADKPS